MTVTPVEQAGGKSAIAAAPPQGRLEEMAKAVLGAAETFFGAVDEKVDRMSANWLGLDDKIDGDRLPFEVLHPYTMPAQGKPLLAEKMKLRSIQILLLVLVKMQIDDNTYERHLRARDKAQGRHNHMNFVQKNRDKTEKTAKSSTTSGTLSGLIQMSPMVAGLFLQHIAAPFTGPESLLGSFKIVPNLNDSVALDDAAKLLRQVLQGPAGFIQNLDQNKKTILQGTTAYLHARAQNALEKGQGASAFMREISQENTRLADEVKRLFDAYLQTTQRLFQQ